MKKIQAGLLMFVVILLIASCTKTETTPPSGAETNAILLAGAKGASKSWTLSSATGSLNGGSAGALQLASCFQDNVYKFTNNSTQDYIDNEGATKCTSTDSTVVESGGWSFTDDGKNLVIDATPYSNNGLFGSLGPVSVSLITAKNLNVSFTIHRLDSVLAYTFLFVSQ